jgi:hypothetical protein
MRKVIPIFAFICLFAIGCNATSDEITYSRTNDDIQLKITHRSGGNSCTITIKNAIEAAQYKARLQRLVREVEDFEKDLSIKEKTN